MIVDYTIARRRMVEEQLVPGGVTDPRVLKAMGQIPRHLFVDEALATQAYEDRPLNIGQGQTISQPLIVGIMTQALGLEGREKVLEVGTGCGYQSAILAGLVRKVFSVERVKSLANEARKRLYGLGYFNVSVRDGDGTLGWPTEAPFDAILVTAGGPRIPAPLLEQLGEGGRLVAPVGTEIAQDLVVVTKKGGTLHQDVLTGCRFVKLVGDHGWNETGAH